MARKKAKQKQRGLDVDDAYYYVKEKEKKEDTKDEKQKKQKEKMENDSELTKKAFKVRKSEVREKSRKKQRGLVDYGSQQKEKKKKDTKEKKKKKREKKDHDSALSKKALEVLLEWVGERVRVGDPPRVSDMLEHARLEKLGRIDRKKLNDALLVDPVYAFNLHQQKKRLSSRSYRPVVSTSLGYLHCDIGFFPKSRHYETPVTFRSGYLVGKDVSSRFVYLVPLRKNRKADSIVSALETLHAMHQAAGHLHPILGISFDRERSVVGKVVQAYLREKRIKFTAFRNSKSKAKFAEGAIRLVRTLVARLERKYNVGKGNKKKKEGGPAPRRWWNLLGDVAAILNRQEIVVGGKRTGFAPADVSLDNYDKFLSALYKAAPAYSAAQFNVDPRHSTFKFSVGDYVRAKLIVTSSAVLGEKRSETNLTDSCFKILKAYPFVTRRLGLGNEYLCIDTKTGEEEKFQETDLVLSDPAIQSSEDRYAPLYHMK
jgi:hypothetical protein